MSRFRGNYTADWKALSSEIKEAANWECVRCGHGHDPSTGYTLTVHHLDGDKANNVWWNTVPLCQRCHLSVQSRVDLGRPWVMVDHTEWFRPYVAGWYAFRYLGRQLTREEVESSIDDLLGLERIFVLGGS